MVRGLLTIALGIGALTCHWASAHSVATELQQFNQQILRTQESLKNLSSEDFWKKFPEQNAAIEATFIQMTSVPTLSAQERLDVFNAYYRSHLETSFSKHKEKITPEQLLVGIEFYQKPLQLIPQHLNRDYHDAIVSFVETWAREDLDEKIPLDAKYMDTITNTFKQSQSNGFFGWKVFSPFHKAKRTRFLEKMLHSSSLYRDLLTVLISSGDSKLSEQLVVATIKRLKTAAKDPNSITKAYPNFKYQAEIYIEILETLSTHEDFPKLQKIAYAFVTSEPYKKIKDTWDAGIPIRSPKVNKFASDMVKRYEDFVLLENDQIVENKKGIYSFFGDSLSEYNKVQKDSSIDELDKIHATSLLQKNLSLVAHHVSRTIPLDDLFEMSAEIQEIIDKAGMPQLSDEAGAYFAEETVRVRAGEIQQFIIELAQSPAKRERKWALSLHREYRKHYTDLDKHIFDLFMAQNKINSDHMIPFLNLWAEDSVSATENILREQSWALLNRALTLESKSKAVARAARKHLVSIQRQIAKDDLKHATELKAAILKSLRKAGTGCFGILSARFFMK